MLDINETTKLINEKLRDRAFKEIMMYGSCSREQIYRWTLEELGLYEPFREWRLDKEETEIFLYNPEESE